MIPAEVMASTVDMAEDAGIAPKSVAKAHCTVALICRIVMCPRVVVTVVHGKHYVVMVTERITNVYLSIRTPATYPSYR